MVSLPVGLKRKTVAVLITAVGGMALSSSAWALPSFSRQTGWSCAVCHTSYPQLTPMGRMFKLLGYTTTNLQQQQKLQFKFGRRVGLLLSRVSQFSIFVQASATNVGGGQAAFGPNTSGSSINNNVQFPQQVSLFYAGEITPHIGDFLHLTYSGGGGPAGSGSSFAFDDSSIVWAHPWKMGSNNLLITGADVNNTPTATDLWNTVPDWRAPFFYSNYSSSNYVPATFIGNAAGAAFPMAGIGTYAADIFGPDRANWIYAEADVYTNANGTGASPVGGYASAAGGPQGRLSGVAPYVRLAYQHDWGDWNWEVGTFAMWSTIYSNSLAATSPIDQFDDYDLDSQLQWLDTNDNNNFTVRGAWIHENQKFSPGALSSGLASGSLNTLNLNATYWYHDHYGVEGGYRNVWGTANPALYVNTNIYSPDGSPDTSSEWIEASYLPWWNTRFSLRYTMYNQFRGVSGASSSASGYAASSYNTLELLAWIAY